MNNSACVSNQSHQSLQATEEVKVMVMRQVGNVSAHNEYNCLPQVATKASFPVVGSERRGKGKKKQIPKPNYNTKRALL